MPGSSVHRILQARILEWVAMPSSRDLPNSGIEPVSLMTPALAGRFFTTSTTWEICTKIKEVKNKMKKENAKGIAEFYNKHGSLKE